MKKEVLIKLASEYLEKQAFNSKPVIDLAGKVRNKVLKQGVGSASNLMSRAHAHLGHADHVGLYSSAEKQSFKNGMVELGKRHGLSHIEAAHAVRNGAQEAYNLLKR